MYLLDVVGDALPRIWHDTIRAINCNTHAEARKMLAMSLKCTIEDWAKAMPQHGGRHVLLAVQVDGCVFVSGVGDVGHLIMCQDGKPMRVEHTPVASANDHAFAMTCVSCAGMREKTALDVCISLALRTVRSRLVMWIPCRSCSPPTTHFWWLPVTTCCACCLTRYTQKWVTAPRHINQVQVSPFQDVVQLVSAVLEDYAPPYSHSIADAAARELLSAAIERGAQGGLAALVMLVPWTHTD